MHSGNLPGHSQAFFTLDLDASTVPEPFQIKRRCEGHAERLGHQKTMEQLGGTGCSRTDGDGWRRGCPLLPASKVNSSIAGPYARPRVRLLPRRSQLGFNLLIFLLILLFVG